MANLRNVFLLIKAIFCYLVFDKTNCVLLSVLIKKYFVLLSCCFKPVVFIFVLSFQGDIKWHDNLSPLPSLCRYLALQMTPMRKRISWTLYRYFEHLGVTF